MRAEPHESMYFFRSWFRYSNTRYSLRPLVYSTSFNLAAKRKPRQMQEEDNQIEKD